MYRIVALGDLDTITFLRAFGLETYECRKPEEVLLVLKKLSLKDYGIILITEELVKELEEELKSMFAEKILPILIEIPSKRGSLGIGRLRIKRLVERAVGVDILGIKVK
jgi:V/A-type H+-transporting ATPase subunit F